jgi:hypothetical protein
MAPKSAMSMRSASNTVGAAGDAANNAAAGSAASSNISENWQELRANADIQFAPVEVLPQEPPDLGWLEKIFRAIGEFLEPLARAFPSAWPFIKWGLIVVGVLIVAYIVYRLLEPYLNTPSWEDAELEEGEWRPDAAQSLALLEDADRLAAEGKFDEATHLLLQRSVTHLADAKPDWVEPSSTARELTAIEALPDKARETFAVIAERVERSLFAMRSLGRDDWEVARAAYADFAAISLRGPVG